MPELPEVEHMGRCLARWTQGRSLVGFDAADPRILRGDHAMVLRGGVCGAVTRRGKYLSWTTGEIGWILHFRMTGQLVVRGAGRARWVLDDGSWVSFEDSRCLGEIWRLPVAALDAAVSALPLGPEPWPDLRDGAWWAARFRGARGPLKPVLMDQKRVAGLGNIAGSEICWRAKLAPTTPVSSLDLDDWGRIADAARAWVDDALASMPDGEISYVNQGGPNPFAVYQGVRCPRCAGPVDRMVQSGRGTWWCPRCQPAA